MKFVIITGLSGAGKTQAIRCLEDLEFYCIDNMPPFFIPKFAEICSQSQGKIDKIALVIDIRGRDLFNELFGALDFLKNSGYPYEILFLEANNEVLIKRYKETRRKHPLSSEGNLIEAVKKEKELLKHVRDRADHIMDTSNILTKELKEQLTDIFVKGKEYKGINVRIISFGFKNGTPLDTDLLFDVRFLPNPYYIDSMKESTGEDENVRKYVLKWPQTQEFLIKLKEMVKFLLPHYIEEGKSQLVIGIGCTGGKHRSVTIADALYQYLKEEEYQVFINHRDIDKQSS